MRIWNRNLGASCFSPGKMGSCVGKGTFGKDEIGGVMKRYSLSTANISLFWGEQAGTIGDPKLASDLS